MAFNINDIKGALLYGGARPTLFKVTINNNVSNGGRLLVPFMVRATTIPAMEIGTIQIPYFGRKIKIAGDRTFAPWSVTVMNDENFAIRNDMEQWSNGINTLNSNLLTAGPPSVYKSRALVDQYDKQGRIIRSYQIDGLYPETVSPIDLDWNATDQIEEFTVTFQYDSFEIVGGTTGTILDGASPVTN